MTGKVKFTPEMALAAKKKHDEEVALVEGYSCLFRNLSLASDIVEQLDYAVDDINALAFKAGVTVLAERGDLNYLTEFMSRVTKEKSECFKGSDELESVLAKSMLALKNRAPMLHAYGKALMFRKAKSEFGIPCAPYVSLVDFLNGTEQEGDSPEVAKSLAACAVIGDPRFNGANLKAWAKADLKE